MNETLKEYCEQADIVFTRCRPYRKNDQTFVEQNNGAVVRRMVGYSRFEGLEAAALLAQLYRSARLFVNFFQPSFKLIRKERDGARLHKTYSAPATPDQRLVSEARTPDAVALASMKFMPDWIRSPYCAISEPCRRSWPVSPTPPQQAIQLRRHRSNSFCRACESRAKRGRSARPTGQLRGRSESDGALIRSSRLRHGCANGSRPSRGGPAANSCASFRQNAPGVYPRKVLRTLQHRLKSWRSEQASALLFSSRENAA